MLPFCKNSVHHHMCISLFMLRQYLFFLLVVEGLFIKPWDIFIEGGGLVEKGGLGNLVHLRRFLTGEIYFLLQEQFLTLPTHARDRWD